jgi:hypothetical protein
LTYDLVQSVFLMSFAANLAMTQTGTASELQSALSIALNGGTWQGQTLPGFFPTENPSLVGGDWSVVWGPQVFQDTQDAGDDVVDNALYVAFSPSQQTYVVAIAATTGQSSYDWVKEDGDVLCTYMAKWPFTAPFTPTLGPIPNPLVAHVSGGTALGVSNLLDLTDPKTGATLQAFLTNGLTAAQRQPATLIFAGHSLAGALSPTLALWLYPEPATSGWKRVLVLPTAGATPGNAAFQTLFNTAYPSIQESSANDPSYGYWNTLIWNKLDIVPHAWTQMDEVAWEQSGGTWQSLYGPLSGQAAEWLPKVMDAVKLLPSGGFYKQLDNVSFTGTWVGTPTPPTTISTVTEFFTYALEAHIQQYFPFFQVNAPQLLPGNSPNMLCQFIAQALGISGLCSAPATAAQPAPALTEA